MRKVIPPPIRRLFTDEYDIMQNIQEGGEQSITVIQEAISSGSISSSVSEAPAPSINYMPSGASMRGSAVWVMETDPTLTEDVQVNDLWIKL